MEHFDRRFSPENLAFWVPRLAEALRLAPGERLLDVGCGTGGLSVALADRTAAAVVGLDRSPRFLGHARSRAPGGSWVEGDAEQLPFDDGSFDAVLLSLVLHQLARPRAAVAEAFRVLRPGGRVVVRTIAPEDAAKRVPARFLPSMAEADRRRLPPLDAVRAWLVDAGFERLSEQRHFRNKPLDLAEEERSLLAEVRGRYAFVSQDELVEGLRQLHAAAAAAGHRWVDPRPTYLVDAVRSVASAASASSGTPCSNRAASVSCADSSPRT